MDQSEILDLRKPSTFVFYFESSLLSIKSVEIVINLAIGNFFKVAPVLNLKLLGWVTGVPSSVKFS